MTSAIKKDKPQVKLRTIKVKGPNGKKTSSGLSDSGHSKAGTEKRTEDNGIQIEEMVNRGLDLAEVGIGLGVNIVARLGTIFKDQVFDKFSGSDILGSVMSDMPAGQQGEDANRHNQDTGFEDQTQTQNNAAASSTQEEQPYYLFNRVTLSPGGDLSLSFSINNDSLTSPKQVEITVEDFIGETKNEALDASLFSVSPDKTEIAAADFEKFTLKAKLPADIPTDTYHGRIIVEEQQIYRISVVLFVSTAQQDSPIHQATQATPQEAIAE